ncbi:hypothetical protein EST38_g13643 [Candolleomyces aberdarensis]|uniref:Uncharacterized protein n=1 Tax=Candolleomyces aberdarensis TaxID=2316362 RepID=A0A4Q2D084_9AGAR|nr:hypothetical protein EST38_g13643 [Candolleomyces aberdarensis]
MTSVSQQFTEYLDLSSRVRTELQALERVSMMGAAAGERYPLLLDVQEKLDEATPKLEALAREVGIIGPGSTLEGQAESVLQAPQSSLAGGDSEALKQLEKDLTSNLSYLHSIPGLVPSESASKDEPEEREEGEMSEESKAIAASFERMLGHKPHPSEVAYGMIPDARTREVWRGIPMARPPNRGQGGAAAGEDEDGLN